MPNLIDVIGRHLAQAIATLLLLAHALPASASIERAPEAPSPTLDQQGSAPAVRMVTPPVHVGGSSPLRGQGCAIFSTRCPTWVSHHDLEQAHDVPDGTDLVAVSPDGATTYLGVSAGGYGARMVAVDVASGEERWAQMCCVSEPGGQTPKRSR